MGHTVSIQNYKMRWILCIFNKFLKCQYILYFLIKPCDLLLLKGYISRHTIAVQLIVIPQDLVQAGGWVMIANRDITSIFNAIFGDDEAVTWKKSKHFPQLAISNFKLWPKMGKFRTVAQEEMMRLYESFFALVSWNCSRILFMFRRNKMFTFLQRHFSRQNRTKSYKSSVTFAIFIYFQDHFNAFLQVLYCLYIV